MEPAVPLVTVPVLNRRDPLFPDADVPVLNTTDPLTPADATLGVMMFTAPLPPLAAAPLTMLTAPPVADTDVVWPACNRMYPPTPLFPVPTTTLTAPP